MVRIYSSFVSICAYVLSIYPFFFLPIPLPVSHPASADAFGVPLEHAPCEDDEVPLIIRACVSAIERRGLDIEGLYRLSGVKKDIERVRLHLSFGRPNFDDEGATLLSILLCLTVAGGRRVARRPRHHGRRQDVVPRAARPGHPIRQL